MAKIITSNIIIIHIIHRHSHCLSAVVKLLHTTTYMHTYIHDGPTHIEPVPFVTCCIHQPAPTRPLQRSIQSSKDMAYMADMASIMQSRMHPAIRRERFSGRKSYRVAGLVNVVAGCSHHYHHHRQPPLPPSPPERTFNLCTMYVTSPPARSTVDFINFI